MADIKVPVFSESVSEGTLLSWSKKPGEPVKRGEVLAEIETDKVVLEVTAQADGTLQSVSANEGDTVTSEQVIGQLGEGGAAAATSAPATETGQPPLAQTSAPATDPAAGPVADAGNTQTVPAQTRDDLSPAVRKMVAETGVDPSRIEATGPRGNLTKGDVISAMQGGGTDQGPQGATAPAALSNQAQPAAAQEFKTPTNTNIIPSGPRSEQRVPMTRIRQRIAERLKDVQNTAAILTTFNEINMKPVMDLRKKYQDAFVAKHGVKLGFMSLFVRAATEALKQFPVINASVDGKDIIYHGFFDIGIAVASERGLVVPILRDSDSLSLADIEKKVAEFAGKAKSGKLSLEEMSGGTFSITNGGTFGSMMSTPILNAPQSAILGMHNIIERPVVEGGQIVARPMMYVALSYDHRIIDGSEAVRFLVSIKNALEDPARMLLEV